MMTMIGGDDSPYEPENIDWGSQDFYYQVANADKLQTPISTADFIAGTTTSEEVRLGNISHVGNVLMFIGKADDKCSVGAAARILSELGNEKKSLTIIEKVDSDADKSEDMGHNEWTLPIADDTLTRIVHALRDGASQLSAVGALTIAVTTSFALF